MTDLIENPMNPADPNSDQYTPKATLDDEERFKTLFDYTKFHIGLYTTLISLVFVLMSVDAFESCAVTLIRYPLAVGIFSIAAAGACGGMIATHIPIRHEQTFAGFLFKEKVGWRGKKSFSVKQVIHAEHNFFWLAVLAFLICVLALLFSDKFEDRHWIDLSVCEQSSAG